MKTDSVTETILVSYDGEASFSFRRSSGETIPDGNLSSYPGTTSFVFRPADAQKGQWSFVSAELGAVAPKDFGASMGMEDDFDLQLTDLADPMATQLVIQDVNANQKEQAYKYSFRIQLLPDGQTVDCDPKIYNKIRDTDV